MESLNFKELLNSYKSIVIPKIQRDYAQGRTNNKAEDVRKNLLNNLFNKDKTVFFDFIFGTKNGEDFIPIDGQQRLTTLFLLFLYDKFINKNPSNNTIPLEKFSYDTRKAAKEFCLAVSSKWSVTEITDKWEPSTDIKNSIWFMDYWQYDPTVEGMLVMLDAIHYQKMKTNFFPKLDEIRFYFFDMDENNLDEKLYIKMNSRGKPLTAFENIKAELDEILPEICNEECNTAFDFLDNSEISGNTLADKWKFYIDRDWESFFWKYRGPTNLIDSVFIRFIANALACYWAVNAKDKDGKPLSIEKTTDGIFKELVSISGDESFVNINNLKKVIDLNKEEVFIFLSRTISIFTKFDLDIQKAVKPNWNHKYDFIKEMIVSYQDNIASKERALFFAISLYPGLDYSSIYFKHWIRVIWNIIENANLNGVSELRLIHSLSELIKLDKNQDIYNVLSSNYELEESDFAYEQINEEIAKSKKITEEEKWEQKFITAEKYAFFNGAIRFLFRSKSGDLNDWNNFDKKWNNAKKYFGKKGVKQVYTKDMTLLKALISRCNNFQAGMWSNKIIFNNESLNWRKLLLDDTWNEAIYDILNGKINVIQNKEVPEINEWCNDKGLLTFIAQERSNAWIRHTYHKYYSFWEYGYPAYMVPTIPILLQLKKQKKIDYRKGCIIPKSNFATCYKDSEYGIDFIYNNNHFRYYMYPTKTVADVYLMNNEWNYVETGRFINSEDDHKKYYCFDVPAGMTSVMFIKKLKELISKKPK